MKKLAVVVAPLVGVLVGAAIVALGRSGPGLGATREFQVAGVVAARPEGRSIRIAHEDIPDFMPAMTMEFAVREEETVPGVAPGDRVRFVLHVTDERSWISGVEVTGRGAAPATARAGPGGSARLKPGDAVPPFRLTDEAGRPVTEADLAGRLTVVTFLFTRCPLPEACPLIAQRFREIQDRTADAAPERRPRLLAVTIDPAFDTPPVLAAYGRAKGADPARWRFATGSPDQVAVLTRAFAVHVESNGATLDHTFATALIGADGRVVEVWRGNFWKASDILEALRPAAR